MGEHLPAAPPGLEPEYQAFPNQEWRNRLQAGVEIRLALRVLHVPHACRVLELGCGRGVALAPLAEILQPSRLVGIDNDRSLLDEAARRVAEGGTTASLAHGDIRAMPFPNGSFDMVIDFGTCYHVSGRDRALREVERILVPGGLFVYESPVSQMVAHPGRTTRRRLPWSAAPLLQPLRRAGLWSSRVRMAGACSCPR